MRDEPISSKMGSDTPDRRSNGSPPVIPPGSRNTATPLPTSPISWKRQLAVMWVALWVTVLGFGFAFPFLPLFLQQDLGIPEPARAALWSGIASGFMGISMFLFGPIWGLIGDRYGRKKNVIRAMFGGAIFLAATGLSANVFHLIVLRTLNGMASGVSATVLALVSSTTPRERIPLSMGALQSAMLLGNTVGPLIGSVLSGTVGFRGAYFVAGGMVAIAATLVFLFARDDFERPKKPGSLFRHDALAGLFHLISSREVAPILATMLLVQIAPLLMFPVLPVLLESMIPGSGTLGTGISFAILGITGALTAYSTGWLGSRIRITHMLAIACVGAGVFYIPLAFAQTVLPMFITLAFAGMFQGILLGSTSGLLAVVLPPEQRSTGFGALQSVSAGAFGFGPLIGGTIASIAGLRSVFLVQAAVLFIASVLVVRLLGGRESGQSGDTPVEATAS
jgi:DHA1 family multidrug resistance protein-like MFS transporter